MINYRSEVQLGRITDINTYRQEKSVNDGNQTNTELMFDYGNKKSNEEIPSELSQILEKSDKITTSKYDNDGNFCIYYNDGSIEKYSPDQNNKYSLSEKTSKTENGHKVEFFDLITHELSQENIIDENNNTLEVREYMNLDSQNSSMWVHKYNSTKEDNNNLIGIQTEYKTNGKTTITSFEINRDKNSDILSVEQTNKAPDGSVNIKRYDGKRGIDKFNAMNTGNFYTGLANEQVKYDEQGNLKERIVREADETGAIVRLAEYDADNNLIAEDTNLSMDDKIGTAYQGRTGDCYLLASLNALAQCPEGQKILKDNITEDIDENGKKIYTVDFPGAKKASESLKTHLDSEKVHITGSYTVSQDELDSANLDTQAFSDGDQNVLLYELAFNKYRDEVKQTVQENNIDKYDTFNISGLEGFIDPNVPIAGGFSSEVDFLLTGKNPDIWWSKKTINSGLMLNPENHSVKIASNIQMDNKKYDKKNSENTTTDEKEVQHKYTDTKGFMKSGNLYRKEKIRDEMLNKAIEDAKDGSLDKNAITAGVYVAYGDNVFIPHAVSIIDINEDKVTFLDSTDVSVGEKRKYEMPLNDFKNSIKNLDVLKFDE